MYLDANVLLEIILRRPNEKIARKLLQEQNDEIFISALTAHLVTHFGRSIVELPVLRAF